MDSPFLPAHPRHSTVPIVDTHTHLVSTFAAYKQKYKDAKYDTVYDFARALYQGKKMTAVVDVWCEVPMLKLWKEITDPALEVEGDRKRRWGELQYWSMMGTSCVPSPARAELSHPLPEQAYIRERRAPSPHYLEHI
jgi:TatD DNase family protein